MKLRSMRDPNCDEASDRSTKVMENTTPAMVPITLRDLTLASIRGDTNFHDNALAVHRIDLFWLQKTHSVSGDANIRIWLD